jgi:hypothetical protein
VLLVDDPATTEIEAKLRINSFRVNVVLDRNENGQMDNALLTTLNCFGALSNISDDCKFGAGCFTVDMDMDFAIDTSGQDPQLLATVGSIIGTPAAVQCEGGANFGNRGLLGDIASNIPLSALVSSLNGLTPEFKTLGLDLGGVVEFENGKLLTIETTADVDCATCRDYIGVTGDFDVPDNQEPTECPPEGP